MTQKVIEKEIKKLINYWAQELCLSKKVVIRRDNRIYFLAVVGINDKKYYLKFNSKKISQIQYGHFELIHLVFHELAHLKKKAIYPYISNYSECEYIAEITALKWLKQYFPKYAKKHIKKMKKILQTRNYFKYPQYYKAFSQIKEYQS